MILGTSASTKSAQGNLGAEFFSIWVDPETNQGSFATAHLGLDRLGLSSRLPPSGSHDDGFQRTDDIERARKEHKLAALMGIEGGHSIENDIHLLRDYYRLGVRYMTLTWSNTNEWADSSGDIDDPKVQHHNGLTDFGKEVVSGDEPDGHDGRHLPRRGQDILGRDRDYEGPSDRLALVGTSPGEIIRET